MKEARNAYERRIHAYETLQEKQIRAEHRFSNYRLTTFLLGFAVAFFLYRMLSPFFGIAMGFLTLGFFIYLAFQHRRVRSRLKYVQILIGLNRKGEDRLTGKWVNFTDTGGDFRENEHPYASDLDMFGQASIFQWVSSAHTPGGRESLARVLKQPLKDRLPIIERQEAVNELAGKLAWRQRFEAEGIFVSDKLKATGPLLEWAQETNSFYSRPWVKWGMRVLPMVTILMLVLFAFQPIVTWQIPGLLFATQMLLLWAFGKERGQVLSRVHHYEASLITYAKMFKHFEKLNVHSPWHCVRQGRLRNPEGRSAFQQIERLSNIAERIANRENAIFLVVNILLLWDYQCMIMLEDWKKTSGKRLQSWLEVLAEVEALASLANIRFEHPDWVMPEIFDSFSEMRGEQNKVQPERTGLSAQNMGHPLLTQKRVTNHFTIKWPEGIALITGSNMSGKSTFLRTVGTNLVFAYTGAPVCAEGFSCSLMNLWTCMRVSDNLEQSISTFYAEMLRIKRIVEAAKTDKPVFFLLDEIFKGTNSHDRHQGAKALINQLQNDGALGLISTHDLELGELEKESEGRVKNHHFREYYQNQEIRFDYRLRPGISTTRNALYLIRMAGIEIKDG